MDDFSRILILNFPYPVNDRLLIIIIIIIIDISPENSKAFRGETPMIDK